MVVSRLDDLDMIVQQLTNDVFTSNSYILSTPASNQIWLVDLGVFDSVNHTSGNACCVSGVLLTHYHYDHIYGLNHLLEASPKCSIFASAHTRQGLYDPKMNLSFYHEDPIVFKGTMPFEIRDGDEIDLFTGIRAIVYSTPGHNPGCLTFEIENSLFTGDAYIPFVPVVTKLKGGNKTEAASSLRKIRSLLHPCITIFPGHGPAYTFSSRLIDDLDEQIGKLQ